MSVQQPQSEHPRRAVPAQRTSVSNAGKTSGGSEPYDTDDDVQHRSPHPRQPQRLDELDLGLVHALQVRPRAPWSLVGAVLGVDPVTVARRWERLTRTGAAWVDGYLSPGRDDGVYAQVEIDTGGRLRDETVQALARDRHMLSLKQTSGGRDLLAIVGAEDLDALSEFVSERVSRLPDVRGSRSHVITAAPIEGAHWRLRQLTEDQQQALQNGREGAGRAAAPEPLREVDRRIALALGADGRMPLAALAEAAETSTATARRRLRVLTTTGRLSLRCALARPHTGYPVSAIYFAALPPEYLNEAVAALRTLPGLRMCSITAGPHNLFLDVWLRSLSEVHTTEAHLNRRLSRLQLRITERTVILRTFKHVGRLLDRFGHSAGPAPLKYWETDG